MDLGVFDSGVGGLTVLKAISKKLPNNKFIYLADTANLPYGDKTHEQILSYADIKIRWMQSIGVEMLSIACNTTDSVLYKANVSEKIGFFKYGIINIIKPTVNGVLRLFPEIKRIGVLATEATTKSDAFKNIFQSIKCDTEVFTVACSGLVPWIESESKDYVLGYKLVSEYIATLLKVNVEGIIYGCTHYPFISQMIKDVIIKNGYNPIDAKQNLSEKKYPNTIILFDPAYFVASEVERKTQYDNVSMQDFELECYITEISAKTRLEQAVQKLFGFYPQIKLVDLKKSTCFQ